MEIKDLLLFFRLLAFTGLRKSEALSLQWKDIDYVNKSVKIYRTLFFDARKHKVIVQTPKTASSEREIELDAKTISLLKSWRIDQRERLLTNGINSMTNEQFLFTQMKSNQLLITNRANDWLKWVYKKYPQKKITVHGFRHTHASLLFEAGASIKEVQNRLGHSNSKTTLDIYTHVTKKVKRDTAEKFAKFMDN
ncbi:site-specific integrase [Liquorilactobacillus mali]|uniref:site-specific integrase n=1 Tax=Liquorilactobacillus mali TaxID=1618 RepID=UPI00138EDF2E|nr:site-specific integrase [Liquorilactobacillus mali]